MKVSQKVNSRSYSKVPYTLLSWAAVHSVHCSVVAFSHSFCFSKKLCSRRKLFDTADNVESFMLTTQQNI